MASALPAFYEPLIERDAAAIPGAIRRYAEEHGADELWGAVTRFAVLAYAPSQHAKHAVVCCLAAHELKEKAGPRYVDLLIECALYAAMSRQPWSEPPIGDPPALPAGQRRDTGEVREAVGAGDRLRAERWLAARMDDRDFARDFFTVASDDFSDLGHKLIIGVAAWKLATLAGARGRFATLRIAPWEWTSHRGQRFLERGTALDRETLMARLIDCFVAERGSVVSAHAVFLLDAAIQAASFGGDDSIELRVRDYLTFSIDEFRHGHAPSAGDAGAGVPVYTLARDYGELLQIHAVTGRLQSHFPSLALERLIAAAKENLENAPSFDEGSFA